MREPLLLVRGLVKVVFSLLTADEVRTSVEYSGYCVLIC